MSYDLLRSLYGGRGTNADLVRKEDLSLLHVETPIERFVPEVVRGGKDVILTGNPGDGKSHAVRLMQSRGALRDAVIEPDLSARPTRDVARSWADARAAGRPFVLCGNEGPLLELVAEAGAVPALEDRAAGARAQIGRLTAPRREDLAPTPSGVVVVDLADRNLLEPANVERALTRVCDYAFLPSELGVRASQTSAGRNIMMLAGNPAARRRLSAVIGIAARRRGGHFTFRQLWQAIAFGITAGKAPNTLSVELYQGNVGLGTFPLDHLTKRTGDGPLLEAVRAFADPADVTEPDLDERLWAGGIGALGNPDKEAPLEVPSRLWDEGNHEGALNAHASLKRYVALFHDAGESIVQRLLSRADLPSQLSDEALLRAIISGLRALYIAPARSESLPDWILSGVPLWIGQSYADYPTHLRPHVAVGVRPADEFRLLRPQRVEWLRDVLGALPDEAWLLHEPSGALLRVGPDLLALFARAPRTAGPVTLPDRVSRYLARLAGWEETIPGEQAGATAFAILERPRGDVIVHGGVVESASGAVYA